MARAHLQSTSILASPMGGRWHHVRDVWHAVQCASPTFLQESSLIPRTPRRTQQGADHLDHDGRTVHRSLSLKVAPSCFIWAKRQTVSFGGRLEARQASCVQWLMFQWRRAQCLGRRGIGGITHVGTIPASTRPRRQRDAARPRSGQAPGRSLPRRQRVLVADMAVYPWISHSCTLRAQRDLADLTSGVVTSRPAVQRAYSCSPKSKIGDRSDATHLNLFEKQVRRRLCRRRATVLY